MAQSAAAAAANERVLIVLCENDGSDSFITRVEAELGALGFRVRRAVRRDDERLDQLARRFGAVASIAVRPHDRAIELWGEDPDSGNTAFSDVIRVDARRKEVSAVAAAEALRGRLLRLGVTPQTLKSEVTRAAPERPLTPAVTAGHGRTEPHVGSTFAIGVGSAVGSASGFARVGLHVDPVRWLSFSLCGNWQLLPSRLRGAEGEASLRVAYATFGADVVLGTPLLRFGVGPGLSLVLVDMEGSAHGAYLGQHDRVFTAAALSHALLSLRVVGPLHARADAEMGLSMPRAVVRFAGREAASFGRPFALATLGFDLMF